VHFHGWPSSRLEQFAASSLLQQLRLRWFSLDRPGYGGTEFHPEHSFSRWAGMVEEWARQQQLDRFHVLGFSGGGPFAQAIAALLPERVLSLNLINSLAPFGPGGVSAKPPWAGPGEWLLDQSLPLAHVAFACLNAFRRLSPHAFERMQIAGFHPVDRRLLSQPQIIERFIASHQLSMQQGVRHLLADLQLYRGQWDFDYGSIQCPTRVWIGSEDIQVPPECGKWLAEQIPGATLVEYQGEAHYIAHSHAEEILGNL